MAEFDFHRMRNVMRNVTHARYNLDKARAIAARNARISGYSSNGDKNLARVAEDAYESARSELSDLREQLTPIVEKMQDKTKRDILYCRYIKGMTPREMAYHMMYSERHMFRMINDAEKDVARV